MIRSIALVAVAAATTLQAQSTADHFTLRGDRLAIYNLAGRLQVDGNTRSETTVDVIRGGSDASKLRVQQGTVAGDDALRVIYPGDRVIYSRMSRFSRTTVTRNSDGTFRNGGGSLLGRDQVEIRGSGTGTEAYADLHVSVARGAHVKLMLGVGEVAIANVDGQLTVDVSSASITADHGRGDLTVDTGSGSIRLADHQGTVKLESGSGSVTLNSVKGERVTAETGSGSITATDVEARTLTASTGSGTFRFAGIRAGSLSLDTGSGSANVELASNADDVVIDTGSGSVTLTLPATASAAMNVSTGSGSIHSDFAVQPQRGDRTSLRGSIGDGKGRIKIDTGSGSVRVLKGRN